MGMGIGIPVRRGIEADGKVCLLRIKLHQMGSAQGGAGFNGVFGRTTPTLKKTLHHVPGAFGLNVTSHSNDRAARTGASRPRGTNSVLGEGLQPSNGAVATAIEWRGHCKLAQADARKVLGLIFQPIESLKGDGTHGFQGVCIQVWLPNDQGKQAHCLFDALAHAQGGEHGVVNRCGTVTLRSQGIEGIRDIAA
jgi:hypothetical protein